MESPQTDPEAKIQLQVVYLGGDPRKIRWGMWKETGKRKKPKGCMTKCVISSQQCINNIFY